MVTTLSISLLRSIKLLHFSIWQLRLIYYLYIEFIWLFKLYICSLFIYPHSHHFLYRAALHPSCGNITGLIIYPNGHKSWFYTSSIENISCCAGYEVTIATVPAVLVNRHHMISHSKFPDTEHKESYMEEAEWDLLKQDTCRRRASSWMANKQFNRLVFVDLENNVPPILCVLSIHVV